MSATCPVDLDTSRLRCEVSSLYARVAVDPGGEFHFHRGPKYASDFLRYDAAELSVLPPEVTASFAGVGNPHQIHPIASAEVVLDIGCGAGMDLLLAARRVRPDGKAIGVDMTEAMAEKACAGAEKAQLDHIEVRLGDATALPLEDADVDVIISNGVLNLVPDKETAFSEIARVLRPGGRLQLADILVGVQLPDDIRRNIDLWTG